MFMSINLKEMEAGNMLDVLHYLFEEDTNFVSNEHIQSRNNIRKLIYKNIYETEYRYATENDGYDYASDDFAADDATVQKPYNTSTVKPYIPPTTFNPEAPNPFQGVLREKPLG